MTGPHLRTSFHLLSMTLRVKSNLTIPTALQDPALVTPGLLPHFHLVPLSLPCLPNQSHPGLLAVPCTCCIYPHLRAFEFTVFSAWNVPLPHLHEACAFSLFKVSIQMLPHQEGFPWSLSASIVTFQSRTLLMTFIAFRCNDLLSPLSAHFTPPEERSGLLCSALYLQP